MKPIRKVVLPQHPPVIIRFEYVDPDPHNREWGYRIWNQKQLRDITSEVSAKLNLKRHELISVEIKVNKATKETTRRNVYEYSWIPAREMDKVEEWLLEKKICLSEREWFYDQRDDGEKEYYM